MNEKKEKDPLKAHAEELAEKLPGRDCCELINRYILSEFLIDDEPGSFAGALRHLFEDHGSTEAAKMAVAIYRLNAESAMRERELFTMYKVTTPSRYAPEVSDPVSIDKLEERLREMMPESTLRTH